MNNIKEWSKDSAVRGAFVASIFAGFYLQKLVLEDYDDEMAKRSLWLFYLFPTAYFLFVPNLLNIYA